MGIVRFKLNGISAFKNITQNGDGRHFCVGCASEAIKEQTLIPFLDGQLHAVLSDFGKDMGAMLSCDQCGEVVGTYYPEGFWAENRAQAPKEQTPLIFKKF